jgi:hypothetical protein
VCARRSGPRARRKPLSEKQKRAVRSRLFGWREILCQETARARESPHLRSETRRRAVESRFSVGKKKKRHLFFDENAVGADYD